MPTLQELKDQANKLGINYTKSVTKKQLEKSIIKRLMSEETKKGNITEAQIKEWKKNHKEVFKIAVEVSENDTAVCYLKKLKRDHIAIALTLYNQDKLLECGEFIVQNAWLGGDERCKKHEDIAVSAAIQANQLVKFLKGNVAKV